MNSSYRYRRANGKSLKGFKQENDIVIFSNVSLQIKQKLFGVFMEKLFLFYCSNECGATEDGDRKDTTYTQEINIMWCLYGRGKGDTK